MKENMLASLGKGDSQAEAAKTERSRKQEATLTALGMRFHSGKGRMRSSIKNRRQNLVVGCRLLDVLPRISNMIFNYIH